MAPTSGDFVGDGVHRLSAFLEPNNAFYCSIGYETMGVESSIVAVEQSMTLDFLDGMLVAAPTRTAAAVMTISTCAMATVSSAGSCATRKRRTKHLGSGRSLPKATNHR